MYTHVALNTKTISKKDPVIIPCNYKRRNIVQTWLKGWILSSHFPLRYANRKLSGVASKVASYVAIPKEFILATNEFL